MNRTANIFFKFLVLQGIILGSLALANSAAHDCAEIEKAADDTIKQTELFIQSEQKDPSGIAKPRGECPVIENEMECTPFASFTGHHCCFGDAKSKTQNEILSATSEELKNAAANLTPEKAGQFIKRIDYLLVQNNLVGCKESQRANSADKAVLDRVAEFKKLAKQLRKPIGSQVPLPKLTCTAETVSVNTEKPPVDTANTVAWVAGNIIGTAVGRVTDVAVNARKHGQKIWRDAQDRSIMGNITQAVNLPNASAKKFVAGLVVASDHLGSKVRELKEGYAALNSPPSKEELGVDKFKITFTAPAAERKPDLKRFCESKKEALEALPRGSCVGIESSTKGAVCCLDQSGEPLFTLIPREVPSVTELVCDSDSVLNDPLQFEFAKNRIHSLALIINKSAKDEVLAKLSAGTAVLNGAGAAASVGAATGLNQTVKEMKYSADFVSKANSQNQLLAAGKRLSEAKTLDSEFQELVKDQKACEPLAPSQMLAENEGYKNRKHSPTPTDLKGNPASDTSTPQATTAPNAVKPEANRLTAETAPKLPGVGINPETGKTTVLDSTASAVTDVAGKIWDDALTTIDQKLGTNLAPLPSPSPTVPSINNIGGFLSAFDLTEDNQTTPPVSSPAPKPALEKTKSEPIKEPASPISSNSTSDKPVSPVPQPESSKITQPTPSPFPSPSPSATSKNPVASTTPANTNNNLPQSGIIPTSPVARNSNLDKDTGTPAAIKENNTRERISSSLHDGNRTVAGASEKSMPSDKAATSGSSLSSGNPLPVPRYAGFTALTSPSNSAKDIANAAVEEKKRTVGEQRAGSGSIHPDAPASNVATLEKAYTDIRSLRGNGDRYDKDGYLLNPNERAKPGSSRRDIASLYSPGQNFSYQPDFSGGSTYTSASKPNVSSGGVKFSPSSEFASLGSFGNSTQLAAAAKVLSRVPAEIDPATGELITKDAKALDVSDKEESDSVISEDALRDLAESLKDILASATGAVKSGLQDFMNTASRLAGGVDAENSERELALVSSEEEKTLSEVAKKLAAKGTKGKLKNGSIVMPGANKTADSGFFDRLAKYLGII